MNDGPRLSWAEYERRSTANRPANRSEWLPDGTWRDPDCIECDGEGAPCCEPPDGPLRLTAGGWCEINGRGWVATFPGAPGFDPRPLTGQQVMIDGKAYMVHGVETFAIPDASGKPFGLLVGER